MAEVKAAVAELTTSPENLVRYQEIYLRMLFYIKLGEKFRRKARLFTWGGQDKDPEFNCIQFSGIARFSAYMFTDCGT